MKEILLITKSEAHTHHIKKISQGNIFHFISAVYPENFFDFIGQTHFLKSFDRLMAALATINNSNKVLLSAQNRHLNF